MIVRMVRLAAKSLNDVFESLNPASLTPRSRTERRVVGGVEYMARDVHQRTSCPINRFKCQRQCTQFVEHPLESTTSFQRFNCRSTSTLTVTVTRWMVVPAEVLIV